MRACSTNIRELYVFFIYSLEVLVTTPEESLEYCSTAAHTGSVPRDFEGKEVGTAVFSRKFQSIGCATASGQSTLVLPSARTYNQQGGLLCSRVTIACPLIISPPPTFVPLC